MNPVGTSRPPPPNEVLVVDGSSEGPAIARALRAARPSLTVRLDASGSTWIDSFAASRPCVVIVDRRIGEVDGLSVLRRVRELDPYCAKVLCTGGGDFAHAIEALRTGCDDYVPREGPWIAELVRRALELVDDGDEAPRHEIGTRTLRDLLEAAPVFVARTSPDGRIEYANGFGLAIAGLVSSSGEEPTVARFQASTADREAMIEQLERHGFAELRGLEMQDASATRRWFDVAARSVRDEGGALRWISMIAIETTERETAFREARANEARYRTLADSIPDLFCVFDSQQRCVYWNRVAESLTGRTADSMLGRPIGETLPRLVGTPSHTLLVRALEEQTTIQVEMRMGLYVPPGMYDVRFLGANGVVAMIARDVTERAHAEERLRAALVEKEVLLQEIHHRVKNNLQVISSLLNLKLRTVRDAALHAQVADMQGRVLAMCLVHEYLYRSGDLGKPDLREYLGRLVEGTLAVLDRSASVQATLAVADMALDLDVAMRLGLVVHELVSNACKHAWPHGRGGRIRIRFGRSDVAPTFYDLVVEDDGVGMPTRPSSRDTLGLELVERLVAPLHGVMRIETDRGTRVRVQFEERSP